jgi:hypothetical protein
MDSAIEAALRVLHARTETNYRGEGPRVFCGHCSTGDPYVTVASTWPCPTIAVLDGANPEDYL